MLLSFIIPVYNCEKLVTRCVESIVKQGVDDYEIILVIDGSPDNSLSVCQDLSHKYCGLKVLNQANQGTSCARNNGLAVACGDYVWFVDADDYVPNGALKKIWDVLSGRKHRVVTFNYLHKTHSQSNEVNMYALEENVPIVSFLYNKPCMYAATKIYLRSALGGTRFLEGTKNLEDLLFNVQFLAREESIYTLPICGYVYDHTNELSTSLNRSKRNLIKLTLDSLLIGDKIQEESNNMSDKKMSIVIDNILNSLKAGHLYSLMKFYTPNRLEKVIKLYRKKHQYPIPYTNNRKANFFLLFANRGLLFITIVRFCIWIKSMRIGVQ